MDKRFTYLYIRPNIHRVVTILTKYSSRSLQLRTELLTELLTKLRIPPL